MADAVEQGAASVPVGDSEETTPRAPDYTGKLCRGETPGTVQGWLIDRMGCRIHFTGTLTRGVYELTSSNVYIPEHLQVGAIDRGE